MTGLPNTRFYLDDGTGTFPDDITSKVLLAEGMTFTRGRGDWQDAPSAGVLNLTLNNADGRFTPGSTVLGSPSQIKVDQRLQVRETVNGVTYIRFTGYVKSWALGWPGVVEASAVVTITVTDAQARAERRVLATYITEEATADVAAALFPLSEPSTATSAMDLSGAQAPALAPAGSGTTGVVFGVDGPIITGLTTAQFVSGGKSLKANSYVTGSAVSGLTLECVFKVSATDAASFGFAALIWGGDSLTNFRVGMDFDSGGHLRGSCAGFTSYSATNYVDNAWHHALVTYDNATGAITLYVDGTSVATGSGTTGNAVSGSVTWVCSQGAAANCAVSGQVANAHYYSSKLSSTQASNHAAAVLNGFANESGTARIARLAGYAGLTLGAQDASLTNVPFTEIADQPAWQAIQDVAKAEGGLAYIDGTGSLVFHNRLRNPGKTAPDLTLPASYVTADTQPTDDDQSIINYFAATAQGTGIEQVVRSTTSETSHGRYPQSDTYLVATDQEALDRANWVVGNFAEPTTRYGTLTVNLYGMPAATQQLVVSLLEPDCWLRIITMPSQTTGGTTVDVVVEGIEETQRAGEWTIRCNVVSRALFNAWILGDPVYGVLGSTTRLGL